jgi:suppressor for copper-sensitivity B
LLEHGAEAHEETIMLKRLAIVVTIALPFVLGVQLAHAQTSQAPGKPDFSADLIIGGLDRSDAKVAWAGVHIRLGPHWHTYWRSPGDAGAAPEFDWKASQNLIAAEVEWPAPRRLTESGIDSFGYTDEVVFPVRLRLRDPGAPAQISLNLTLFVCGTICTGNNLHFDATLSPGARFSGPLEVINRWRSRVPRARAAGLSIASATLLPKPEPSVRMMVIAAAPLQTPDVFVDGDDGIIGGRAQFVASDGGATIITVPLSGPHAALPSRPLSVTLLDGDQAVEAIVQAAFDPAHSADAVASDGDRAGRRPATAWPVLAVALLGGFVLNFMPCVFPVLALKMFSLVGHGSRDRRAFRTRFVASAAGVITSFLLLAAALSVFKAAGAQVGWGIQFQQPLFLVGMMIILVALAGNLFGFYDILLPAALNTAIAGKAGDDSAAAHFINGLAMTLLATPCSAPFVGTAVAFALSQRSWQMVEIFAALGIGMASPYLLLAVVPQVARVFPRPGSWMLILRPVAGVAMVGTAIWLLTILAQVVETQVALAIGVSLGAMVSLLALRRRGVIPALVGTLMTGIAAMAIVLPPPQSRPTPANTMIDVQWQPFVPEDIDELVQNGHTVFVNIGAAWCVTCKVNDAVIASSDAIRGRLADDVVGMRGDWTRHDDALGAYLQSFHRYGLPFDAVFGPGAPTGIVLPELLTQAAVLAAIDHASTKSSTSH